MFIPAGSLCVTVCCAITAPPQDAIKPNVDEHLSQPREGTSETNGAIHYEPIMLDFGDIDKGDKLTRTISITNVSEEAVRFVRAFTTCGCAVPDLPREPFDPGETIAVDIEYQAKNEGQQSSTVRLYLASGRGEARIDVKANVRAPIVLEPEKYAPDLAKDLEVKLRSTDGSEFKILAVDPPVLDGLDDKSREEHTVTLSAGKLKQLQNRILSVRIYVNHPRTQSVLLKSTRFENSPQAQRLIAWARGDGEVGDLPEIIANGADVYEVDPRGFTALMYAAVHGDAQRVRALMDFGADPAVTARNGETALMLAARAPEGEAATIRLFLDAGADVNARDQFGRTALYWAARSGDPERIQMLLDAGADLSLRGPFNETVLISAAKGKRAENVKMLVEAGADVYATDSNGHDALYYATQLAATSRDEIRTEREEMVRYLTEKMKEAGGS